MWVLNCRKFCPNWPPRVYRQMTTADVWHLTVAVNGGKACAVSTALYWTVQQPAPAYEICALLGCNAASSGNPLPTFRDSVSVPSSRVKKSDKSGFMPHPLLCVFACWLLRRHQCSIFYCFLLLFSCFSLLYPLLIVPIPRDLSLVAL
jgi:hypothetical protein